MWHNYESSARPANTYTSMSFDLRDLFAALAMHAMVNLDCRSTQNLAIDAYEMADAMLAAREKVDGN